MPTPPNVILVLVDQLRAFEVGCYGNTVARTPHLDRLAAEGVRFETAITNNPVCTPARSCLLSGQYGRTCTGEVGNVADEPPCPRRRRMMDATLAECFQRAGYHTSLIGKWHIDVDPRVLGFDEAYFPLINHRYRGQRYFKDGVLGGAVEGFAPEHESELVDEFLATRPGDPFFLYYNISLPHMPIGPADLPERYATMHDPAAMPIRANAIREGKLAHNETWFRIYTIWDYFSRIAGWPGWNVAAERGHPPAEAGHLPTDTLPDGFDLRSLYALYYGATSWVDDLVGKLMASLARHGLDRDTLVVFLSDHGDNLGSHQLFNKDCLYEESVRVPAILWQPSLLTPRVNRSQIANLIDIMPTVVDLAGLEIPESVQGRSLAPVARGEQEALDDNVAFIETDPSHFKRPIVGIRTPRYLYGAFTGQAGPLAEGWALFDLEDDPLQERNLLGREPDVESALRGRLAAWHEGTRWLEPGSDAAWRPHPLPVLVAMRSAEAYTYQWQYREQGVIGMVAEKIQKKQGPKETKPNHPDWIGNKPPGVKLSVEEASDRTFKKRKELLKKLSQC